MSNNDLFRAVLQAPDRDHTPGARPVVSYRSDDEPAYLEAVNREATRLVTLRRRDVWHGECAELSETAAVKDSFPLEARLNQRWHEAQPILLRGCFDPEAGKAAAESRKVLYEALTKKGGLEAHLQGSRLPGDFEIGRPLPLADPQRDLERHSLVHRGGLGGDTSAAEDLWIKSARLSNHTEDSSLRLRFSFGVEGPDDASKDHNRHKLVSELAEAVLPEAQLMSASSTLGNMLNDLVGETTVLTQHIAYWNAPNGGARFHHDVLAGQLGVAYAQLGGETAWLTLSSSDLAARVLEALEYMHEGELDWVREALWPEPSKFQARLKLAQNPKRCIRELSQPGGGSLGKLIDSGPEFTGLLADAGHCLILEPGDVLLLPNHGRLQTCMHSVFCASDQEVAYGLSTAIRPAQVRERPPQEDRPPSLKRQRAQRRRRRR